MGGRKSHHGSQISQLASTEREGICVYVDQIEFDLNWLTTRGVKMCILRFDLLTLLGR